VLDDWDQVLDGIALFNREEFYDCHDTIEEIWLQESSDEQPFLQGLIQSAVAFHHYQHGKLGAARSMLSLAIEKLEGFPETHHQLLLKEFLEGLRAWKAGLDQAISLKTETSIPESYPKIEMIG
jgi:predicted metal-dependent hydrolase